MRAISRNSSWIECTTGALFFLWLLCLPTRFSGDSVHQATVNALFGIAWNVKGPWKIEGQNQVLSNGDAIPPGSLLHPAQAAGEHSILILLPDGQRILYECFMADDCARGFRVPALYRKPDPLAIEFLARIHQVLISQGRPSPAEAEAHSLPRDETAAALDAARKVQIGGLAAALSNGDYTYNLRPLDSRYPPQFHVAFTKTGPSVTLALPGAGLYDLTIFDRLNRPRIDFLIAAVDPRRSPGILKSFSDATALIEDWNGDYQGWPIHDFRRAYLQSLVLNILPKALPAQASAADPSRDPDLTAEPAFAPKPGLFDGDTAVTLRCNTPGAVMRYTVDGSQPLKNSPVYSAPIIVKGTALTIKAFAMAPGKKASAVVTGIFRIRD